MIKILTLGDIVGSRTVETIRAYLWGIRRDLGADLVIANGENASTGNGLSAPDAKLLLESGVDVITSGNHIWKKNDLRPLLDVDNRILRPANYPSQNPGVGYTVVDAAGWRVLVISLIGQIYLEPTACPFDTTEKILHAEEGSYDISILDIHAEATSEKLAVAYEFDGRLNAVVGTHTHVQTADERVLPGGTAFITDLGMCGPDNGILGVAKEEVIKKLRTKMPVRFQPADGNIVLCGALISIDGTKTVSIERIKIKKH